MGLALVLNMSSNTSCWDFCERAETLIVSLPMELSGIYAMFTIHPLQGRYTIVLAVTREYMLEWFPM